MGKLVVRLTIVLVSIYFVLSYIVAHCFGIDILEDWYSLLFELCVVIYTFSEGAYHCKFIKFTALSLFLSDLITKLDNTFDFIPVAYFNFIPIAIMALGIGTSITLAFRHFYKVRKLKKQKNVRK